MPEQLVPTVNTKVTPADFARALLRVWPEATKEGAGILYAQYALETANGASCWNWNLGNVKYTRGCGYDYVQLRGNKEYVNGVYVVTAKEDPASWFRSYPNLEAGMRAFVTSKLEGQWKSARPFVEAGDPEGYAAELRKHAYYTAPLATYQAAMRGWFDRWMKSGAWEEAIESAPDTLPVPVPSVPPPTLPDFDVVYALPDPPDREIG